MTDKEIVDSFLQTRSEKSFRILYRSQTPGLISFAVRLSGNRFLADDLIQEMWVIAIRKLDTFQWRSQLRTWLIRILINLAREQHREISKWEEGSNAVTDASVKDSVEIKFDLEQALIALPLGYRKVIMLHDIEGFKHNEIAEMLGISEGTSKSQLFNARKLLREKLK
jgi:RNA polymerase sigma-70 factor, ECF subfamily